MRDNFENRTLKSISKQFILIWGGGNLPFPKQFVVTRVYKCTH